MSFILDALRKSELERQRQSGPSIAEMPTARDDRRLPVALVAIGVLLAVNVAVLMYLMMRDGTAPATRSPAAAVAAAPASTAPAAVAPAAIPPVPEPEPAGDEAGFEPMDAPPESMPPPAPDPTLLPEAQYATGAVSRGAPPPPVEALPPQATAGLADLRVDLHIYATDPARRAVFINGRRYTEGMALAEGPMVEEITRDGVVINHRGQRFLLPRN